MDWIQSKDPVENFEYLWNLFEQTYAFFDARNIDWHSIYRMYKPLVEEGLSDRALFDAMQAMLSHLGDSQVVLRTPFALFSVSENERLSSLYEHFEGQSFTNDVLVASYLRKEFEDVKSGAMQGGWIDADTALIRIEHFEDEEIIQSFHKILTAECNPQTALILDVRNNLGGDEDIALTIASMLGDTRRLYAYAHERGGTPMVLNRGPVCLHVGPERETRHNRKVIVLINQFTMGAAEHLVLALRAFPHTILVGQRTGGTMANVFGDVLPNGWNISVPYRYIVDFNHECYEGIGIPADVWIYEQSLPQEYRDPEIEVARKLLKENVVPTRPCEESKKLARNSAVTFLEQQIEQQDMTQALATFQQIIDDEDSQYYCDGEEILELSEVLKQKGKLPQALQIFEYLTSRFAEVWWFYSEYADLLLQAGDKDKAFFYLLEAISKNPKRFPWEKEFALNMELTVKTIEEGPNKALQMYYELSELMPTIQRDGDFLFMIGERLSKLGYDTESKEFFKLAETKSSKIQQAG